MHKEYIIKKVTIDLHDEKITLPSEFTILEVNYEIANAGTIYRIGGKEAFDRFCAIRYKIAEGSNLDTLLIDQTISHIPESMYISGRVRMVITGLVPTSKTVPIGSE